MKLNKLISALCIIGACVLSWHSHADITQKKQLDPFIDKMVTQHQFERAQLEQLFKSVQVKDSILKAMSRPAEGMPWYKYRKIFLTEKRIQGGIKFWQQHAAALDTVAEHTGVPAEIIVAIIGVETQYGGNTGSYRVIDALSTLGFAYPKRSKFFLGELENFLILCRDQDIDPLQPTGSYAGAMGLPQFMPSSYRSYAADFEGDGLKDIWENPADAIASVANYFVRHHWQAGEAVTFPVSVAGKAYKSALQKGLKPNISIAALKKLEVAAPAELNDDLKVRLLEFEMQDGKQHWIGLNNFYVITRYNHSQLYAMAVYQLSQEILNNKK